MEKYYLSSVDDIDYNRRIKLVEITYSRKAPSFGVVYVSSRTNKLHLRALELKENNEVYFADSKRSQEHKDDSSIVDYDTLESLSSEEKEDLQCIILTSGGTSLHRCQLLKDGALNELEVSINRRDGPFTWCRLNCEDSQSYIHVLSHKCYILMTHKTNQNAIEQINRYSLMDSRSSNHLTFTRLDLFPSNVEYALLALSDQSLRIINGKRGYSLINLDLENSRPLHYILPADNSSNCLLLSYSQDSLTAHSLILNQNNNTQLDPDGLLVPSKNSLEVEKCWTIDFGTLESMTAIDEDEKDEDSRICLASLWSSGQISAIHGNSKYLVVGRYSNLLVYSFESLSNPSFPVVYDRFFAKDDIADKSNQTVPMIDQKSKPSLVHNFKLTGTQTTDALWNTIFHTVGRRTNLVEMHHFQQMGILVTLTDNGHLLCFRFDSDEIPAQRGNLYQQQVSDSIKGSSGLLLNTIEMLQETNKKLRQDITQDTTRLFNEGPQQENLDNLISATLAKRSDIGAMYSLNISISDLIQVNQIVITSSVNSLFMNPIVGASFIETLAIDNNYSSSEGGILLADADPESSVFQQKDSESIMASVLIVMKAGIRNVSIQLPVFIMDGMSGSVKMYFLMNGRENEQSARYAGTFDYTSGHLGNDFKEMSHTGAFMLNIRLRVLHSYQHSDVKSSELELTKVLKVNGSFSISQMMNWLDKCILLAPLESNKELNVTLFSQFTYCFIKLKLQDGHLEFSSDDMFAKEVFRKLVLEKATSSSIKLDISGSQGFDEEGLNHLLRMQYRNLEIISKMSKQSKKGEIYAGNDERDLLLELLRTEMNLSELKVDFRLPSEDETIRSLENDIEIELRSSLTVKPNKSIEGCNEEETAVSIFRSLICGHIVDCLADFNKFQGFKVEEEKLVSAQAKLLQLLLEDSALNMDSFLAWVHLAQKSSS